MTILKTAARETSLARAPKKCTQSRNFQFYIKFPSDFRILSVRNLKTLFQKYKLQLTKCIHSCIGHALRKYIYREILKDTTTAESHENVAWKSEIHMFFSLYRDYSNSLTLSNTSELFWS